MNESPKPNPTPERSVDDGASADAALDAQLRAALGGGPPGFRVEAHYRRVQQALARAASGKQSARVLSAGGQWREALARLWLPIASFGLGAASTAVLILALHVSLPGLSAKIEPLGEAQPGHVGPGAVLQVRFRDDTTVATLRADLRAANAHILSGPSALGIWRLSVPPEMLQRSVRALAGSPSVLEVHIEP